MSGTQVGGRTVGVGPPVADWARAALPWTSNNVNDNRVEVRCLFIPMKRKGDVSLVA